jgi:dGTPase
MARALRDRRRFPERPDRDDTRTPFQHDRDRILYSNGFRRLAGVTQVVGAGEGHVFHNRLTHSLRVAQVARRLAERLLVLQADLANEVGVDPDVVEAAGLAHDLGHPPFGHVAEKELDRLLREDQNIADGFEGNAQSFRILTRLALRRQGQGGLNLTRATLDAVLKYPWPRDTTKPEPSNRKWRKFGAYEADQPMFRWVRHRDKSDRADVEASIMDWADDVTYAVHDLDDFVRGGLIPFDRLLTSERERDVFVDASLARWAEEGGKPDITNSELRTRFNAILDLIGALLVPLREPFTDSERHRAALRRVGSLLVSRYIKAVELEQRRGETRLRRETAFVAEVEMLKQLTWHYVIRRPSLASQQVGHRAIVTTLFGNYVDAMADGPNRATRLDVLPQWAKEQLARDEKRRPKEEARSRVAADIVCWMSEQQAIDMHTRMSGVSLGSITDLL